MQQQSWLLPDGIVELTGYSAQKLERIRRTLLDLYQSWGYSLIFPPLVEFLDSLIAGAGDELELQTFKVTDQISGRMLGVRADITPQVARHDAYHNTGEVNRLCYAGSVLHTKPTHILANRSLIQAGAELYGHHGVASDLEILELLLSSLALCDDENSTDADWTLTVGHASLTRALLEKLQLPAAGQDTILRALKNRSEPDLVQAAGLYNLSTQQVDGLIQLVNLCGSIDILKEAAKLEPSHEKELESLQNIHNTCSQQYQHINWFFDFSSINNYSYESGITFHATHAKSAEPLARGGRYDYLSQVYGANRPAVGFSCDLLALARKTSEGLPQVERRVWAPSFAEFTDITAQNALRQKVQSLRVENKAVTTSVHQKSWQQLDSSIQEKYDGYLEHDGKEWVLKSAK